MKNLATERGEKEGLFDVNVKVTYKGRIELLPLIQIQWQFACTHERLEILVDWLYREEVRN